MNARKMLVPLDDSALSKRTVERLLSAREGYPYTLTLLHVLDLEAISYRGFAQIDPRQIEANARAQAEQYLEAQQKCLREAGYPTEAIIREGHPRETICALADSGDYALLLIGRQTDNALRNVLFGSIAHYLVHHVRCPVMIL